MRNNIILIGFMGAGKSCVGRILAEMLNYTHIDIDSVIEKNNKMTISDIFEKEGEDFFRKEEYEVIHGLNKDKLNVISCGGGSVLNRDNVNYLHSIGMIIYLKASSVSIMSRLMNCSDRPLLARGDENLLIRIDKLMHEREQLYDEACDFSINTDDLNPEEVAFNIKKMLKY